MSEQISSIIDRNVVPVGQSLPAGEKNGTSVSLPKLEHVKAYEEGDPAFRAQLQGGYPRFVFQACYKEVCDRYRHLLSPQEDLLVLPSAHVAEQCLAFIGRGRLINTKDGVTAAVFPKEDAPLAKSFWQHTGLIISSRQAEAILANKPKPSLSTSHQPLKERLARLQGMDPHDIYVSPTGMAAIFGAYQAVTAIGGPKTIQLGFPYVDTLEIQKKFGKGAAYVPYHSPDDLETVRRLVATGDIAAVFCEVPGNPLLKTIDLPQLKAILAPYNVPLIVDNTLGPWQNIDVSPYADLMVTSLTKYFAGKGVVMGGAVALNRKSPHYLALKGFFQGREQLLYPEDAEVLLENSRDLEQRMETINRNTVQLAAFLRRHPAVRDVYYTEGDPAYEALRKKDGGYGGLLSFTLHDPSLLAEVYDHLRVAKGPGLGTDFTLVCPYPLLAHYGELDKLKASRVPADLIRVAVGTENGHDIVARFRESLDRALSTPDVSRTYFVNQGVRIVPAARLALS